MALHAVRWDGSPAPRPRPVLQAQHTVSPGLLLEVPLGAGPVCRAKPCRRRSEGDHILLSASPPGIRAKELSSQVLAGPWPGPPGASGCCAAQICLGDKAMPCSCGASRGQGLYPACSICSRCQHKRTEVLEETSLARGPLGAVLLRLVLQDEAMPCPVAQRH